jgi:hypothetical protein
LLRQGRPHKCFWPVPLTLPSAELPGASGGAVQLRLIADDGYEGPAQSASRPPALRPALPRRKTTGAASRQVETNLL